MIALMREAWVNIAIRWMAMGLHERQRIIQVDADSPALG
jgi:hypothetical protein